MNPAKILNLFNIIFRVIPLLLIVYSFSLLAQRGFFSANDVTPLTDLWKIYWHLAFYFFIGTFFVILFLGFQLPHKTFGFWIKLFRTWTIGFLCSALSFAIAGILVDAGIVVYLVLFARR